MNLEKKMEDESDILNDIKDLAKQISQLNEEAYHVYKPLVDDICNRRASKKDVERLLDRLFGFAGNDRILELYKQVCRSYWQIYPDSIAYYIMDYRKYFDPESLLGTKYEYLLDEFKDLDD